MRDNVIMFMSVMRGGALEVTIDLQKTTARGRIEANNARIQSTNTKKTFNKYGRGGWLG